MRTTSVKREPGHRKLFAFQKADVLASRAYALSRVIARDDRWLASQLRRAALSAVLNIVEGHGRGTLRDFLRFLEQSGSSLNEVEYLLYFVRENDILPEADVRAVEPIRDEAAALVHGLMKSLHKKISEGQINWQRNILSDNSGEYRAEGWDTDLAQHYDDEGDEDDDY